VADEWTSDDEIEDDAYNDRRRWAEEPLLPTLVPAGSSLGSDSDSTWMHISRPFQRGHSRLEKQQKARERTVQKRVGPRIASALDVVCPLNDTGSSLN